MKIYNEDLVIILDIKSKVDEIVNGFETHYFQLNIYKKKRPGKL